MRVIRQSVLLLCLWSMGIQTLDIAAWGADEVAAQAPSGYSSPQEAFQSRRAAIARRDWRSAFASMTPATQDQAVVEIAWAWLWLGSGATGHETPWGRSYPPRWPGDRFYVLGVDETPWDGLGKTARDAAIARVRKITKAHGLELQKFQAENEKRGLVGEDEIVAERRKREIEQLRQYLKEHPEEREEGEKFLREHPEAFGTGITELQPCERLRHDLLEPDIELEARVILSQLVDKAGFYEEAMELIKPRVVAPGQEDYVFGDLQGVTVSGDTARGWVVCRSEIRVNGVREAIKPGRVLCRFRRMNGRWYNDNREGDLTRYDSPRDR